MPIRSSSNNRVLPSNSRAVDVAKQAIYALTPVQQRKYDNAFQVQGYDSLVYTRLEQGVRCSCMSGQSNLGTLLMEDGKMPVGKIDELLTGGMVFKVNRYGARQPDREDLREPRGQDPKTRQDQAYDGLKNENTIQPPTTIVSSDLTDPFTDEVVDSATEGVDGHLVRNELDELADTFDINNSNSSDNACAICFGSGFVGGFTVLGSWRQALSSEWGPTVLSPGGTIEVGASPFFFRCLWAEFTTILPKGFVALDSLRVWNNAKLVTSGTVLIDGSTADWSTIRTKCDGLPHVVRVQFDVDTDWTHLEIQIGLTTQMSKIDFPKMVNAGDQSKLDATDDVQINASPMIPYLSAKDVIIEHTFGKAFQVGSINPWNDKSRNVLGWDCSCRVIQPNEVLNLLPRRRITGQRTTNPVRDNRSGVKRT